MEGTAADLPARDPDLAAIMLKYTCRAQVGLREERLQDLLIKHQKTDSAELIARTMEAVVQWTGAGELQDDMTMVVARRI